MERISTKGIVATYTETSTDRVLSFTRTSDDSNQGVQIRQNKDGYAILQVCWENGDEIERYYGFDMALDHVGELLNINPTDLPVPDVATDMGL